MNATRPTSALVRKILIQAGVFNPTVRRDGRFRFRLFCFGRAGASAQWTMIEGALRSRGWAPRAVDIDEKKPGGLSARFRLDRLPTRRRKP